jgi:hypothetical protein
MEELKARYAVVHQGSLIDAKESRFVLFPYIVGEFCFLQLRVAHEPIAPECLITIWFD